MTSRLGLPLRRGWLLLRHSTLVRQSSHPRNYIISANESPCLISCYYDLHTSKSPLSSLSCYRFLSTSLRRNIKPKKVDIGARARQLQARRLWTYALIFSFVAGFIVLVLCNFQDQLVFYVTPTDALQKFDENPNKNKFRLGGLVLEGSVVYPASSPEMEFVITDLITDVLVRYQGPLPDLFREGHSAVVEGFIKPLNDEIRNVSLGNRVASEKARKGDYYLSASEVLAKHDEKYMPADVAAAIEKNKKMIEDAEIEKKKNTMIKDVETETNFTNSS